MGNNPSLSSQHHPRKRYTQMTWNDCQAFVLALNRAAVQPVFVFRLPTEAEWEYACRAGTEDPFAFGETISTQQASFLAKENAPVVEAVNFLEVGTFKPNAWDLFDMHGNVEEWCYDWLAPYPPASNKDSQSLWACERHRRVFRGGNCIVPPVRCRVARRGHAEEAQMNSKRGLRIVLGPSIESLQRQRTP